MFRPRVPQSCDECRQAQEFTADPTACFFGDCPFEALAEDPDLPNVFRFAMRSVEKWAVKDKTTKQDRDQYGLSPERFRLACDEFLVPRERMYDAHEWVDLVARSASEAPDIIFRQVREQNRRQRQRD